jgi:Undecaprenyl-phosphate glucose phosphotransferase
MPLTHFSYPSTDQAEQFPGSDWSADGASGGNRISIQYCVVIFLLFDLLTMAGVGFLVTEVGASYGLYPSAAIDNQALTIGVALFLFIVLAFSVGAYKSRCILDVRYSVGRIIIALFITFLVLLILGATTKTSQIYSQVWFLSWAALACAVLPAFRVAARAHIREELDNKGAFVFRALSVGIFGDPLSREEISQLTDNQVKTANTMRLEGFDPLAKLSDRIAREDIDRIYVTVSWINVPTTLKHLQVLRKFSVQVFVIPNYEWVRSNKWEMSHLGDLLFLKAVDRQIDDWGLWLKRVQDIVVATIAIAIFLPILLAVPLAIKLESRGPIIFRQKRVGLNGSIFEVWKFRSMYTEQTDPNAALQTGKDDPRVTRVGRLIRRSSIDELPQFFNVLKGSMSVVGPRPHALGTRTEGQRLEELVDSYAARQRYKPGLTGWAQINGLRGELDTVEKLKRRVEHDIEYIENWSIWFDLKIILRTLMLVVYDPTAY